MTDQTVTAKLGIVDLMRGTDLSDAFDDYIIKTCNERGMIQCPETEAFIFSKLDELTEYVDANRNKDGTIVAELKTLIGGWIADQDKEITISA
jgi:hypothetical protein